MLFLTNNYFITLNDINQMGLVSLHSVNGDRLVGFCGYNKFKRLQKITGFHKNTQTDD